MNISSKYLHFLVMVSLFFLSSCTNNSGNFEKNVYSGTTGIIMDFSTTPLPSEVYEQERIDILFKLVNKGAYDAKNGKLIARPDKLIMRSTGLDFVLTNIDLEGKSVIKDYDDFELVRVPIQVLNLPPLVENQNAKIDFEFCYDYSNVAIADVCIDTDPYDITPGNKPCSVKNSIGFSNGQGGPVGVSKIEERIITEGDYIMPEFKIYFKNFGNGIIGKCSEDIEPIRITSIKLSNFDQNDFRCYPNPIELENEDFITCTLRSGALKKDQITTFKTQLIIESSYSYTIKESKTIKVVQKR